MITVLVVDDEQSLSNLTSIYLSEDPSIICETADSGTQAQEMIEKNRYDVVVSDYAMPDMSGIELMKTVHEKGSSLPFIIFTGRGHESVAIEALNAGAQFYLQKGGDMEVRFHELSNMVKKVFDKKRAENQLVHINQLYAVLSEINRKIIQISEPKALYSELCKVAIEKGGFSMAWVGLVDSAFGAITSVTHAGKEEGYIERIRIDIEGDEGFFSPTGTEILEGHCAVNNDIGSELLISELREKAIQRGYRSKASVPFSCQKRFIGTFNLYSERPGFFEGSVIDLLENIGKSISYALEHIKYKRERKLFHEALSKANTKLNILSSITRHDILNQITALLGYLEISKGYVKDTKVLNFIEREELITTTIQRQIEFTKDYQDIGVREPLWVKISSLIKQVCRNIKLNDVTLEIGDLEIEIFADFLLEKIFSNLFDNSLKYAEGLKIIRINLKNEGDSLVVLYEDDGPGIPDKEKEKIFLKGYGKNAAFGLFLSREILSITGLSMSETGIPGDGVRFEIRVPKGLYREVRSDQ